MRYLYKFEVDLADKSVTVIVAADSEEAAFTAAEQEVEKCFLKLPEIGEITLLEKKPLRKTAAFMV
ncbi:DUF3906 family protein [Alkalihalobacillus oceani]|uniref:DUF3906 family protein n=1 Tax=Halalkalibacter oceani TaxID=1653776 RepID=UPI0020420FBA|nr:DUF3906 family protein [Halalkalibacter oceani]MCM3760412.1 DUF3906 family protein [Halalkalibacter oceani]